jgi:dTDP-4-dehydrorhamnose reductase
MKKTRIAIVGANGQVGTELCFLFRSDEDVEIIPITRNVLGSTFLDYHGFNCKIADVCKKDDARALLQDIDVIVIAAYADVSGKRGLHINRSLIENCVSFSKPSCRIIYFSTIRAYAGKVDTKTPRISIPITYDRHKRILENICLRACKKAKKKAVVVRLGHVFGEIQPRTEALKEYISTRSVLKVQVFSNMASNVVHTVTIKDCIRVCAHSDIKSGLYSLVNSPQWSWREIFNYYNQGGTRLLFEDEDLSHPAFSKRVINGFLAYVEARRNKLRELRQFLPIALDEKLKSKFDVQRIKSDILLLENSVVTTLYMSEFAYKPMPGKTIPGLSDTKSLLHKAHKLDNIFTLNAPE